MALSGSIATIQDDGTLIEPSLSIQPIVNQKIDGKQFMCQKFIQYHWVGGELLTDDDLGNGKKLYGKEIRDEHNECLPHIKKEESVISTIVFEKNATADEKCITRKNSSTAIIPQQSEILASLDSNLATFHSSTLNIQDKASKHRRKRRHSPMKNDELKCVSRRKTKSSNKKAHSTKANSKVSRRETKHAFKEKTSSKHVSALFSDSNIDNAMNPTVKLSRIKFNALNRRRLNCEFNYILMPKANRNQYNIISLDNPKPIPIRTQPPKQLERCSINIKRLKSSKPSVPQRNEIEEPTDLPISVDQRKLKTVNFAAQLKSEQCDAIIQTDKPVVEKKFRDFSCQTFIPDFSLATANQKFRNLKHEMNLREERHQADILALRRLLVTKHTCGCDVLTSIFNNCETEEQILADGGKFENPTYSHTSIPRQLHGTTSVSSCIRMPPTFNFEMS